MVKTMEEQIGFCGLACHDCDAFKATQSNDKDKKVEIAGLWSQQFKIDMKPEDIDCDGCQSETGRRSGYCRVCGIRQCGESRRLKSCAFCASFPCDKLEKFLLLAPEAKQRLEEKRKTVVRL